MDVGTEWLIDAYGCSSERLADPQVLQGLCQEILQGLGLHVVGQGHWHRFPAPGGVTALFLLTESHLSLHTYPEHGVATINLYCCRPRPRWTWEERLAHWLGATQTTVRQLVRGELPVSQPEASR